jgi:hypothetical protein
MTVRYPVADNPEAALSAPLGRAAREKEAEALAGEGVVFVRELSGPAFSTRDAALAIYGERVDEGGSSSLGPEDRFCQLMEVLAPGAGRSARGQAQPVFTNGRRWPDPKTQAKTVWRLSVGYWRPLSKREHAPLVQARRARRTGEGGALDAQDLRRMSQQPLKALKPQQPLDIGLFETPLPEDPNRLIPDE